MTTSPVISIQHTDISNTGMFVHRSDMLHYDSDFLFLRDEFMVIFALKSIVQFQMEMLQLRTW